MISCDRSRTGDGSGGRLEVKPPAALALAAREHGGHAFLMFDPLVLVGGPLRHKSLFSNSRLRETVRDWLITKACNKGVVRIVTAM
jgi:hypothetical protein